MHKLERQLALARRFAEDMQAASQAIEDQATPLDEEAERLQEEVIILFLLMFGLTDAMQHGLICKLVCMLMLNKS